MSTILRFGVIKRFLFIALMALPLLGRCQSVTFQFNDGTWETIALSEVRKFTFSDDVQVIWLVDGTQYGWNVSTVGYYGYGDLVTGDGPLVQLPPLVRLQLHPNPAAGSFTVAVELAEDGPISLDILDLGGRTVAGLFSGYHAAGPLTMHWPADRLDNGSALMPGSYLCRISTKDGSTAKQLIIQ